MAKKDENNITKRLDIHREELNDMQICVKTCQISIAQHDERLHAEEENRKRQNGLLEELAHGIHTTNKKIDAFSLSVAGRINDLERTFFAHAAEVEKGSITRDAETNLATTEDINILRAECIKRHTEAQSKLQWKIIAAVSSVAFILFIVILTVSLHIFGALPSI